MPYKIIAVIVSLNRPQLLERCVKKLENQKLPLGSTLEILIVDNGSETDLKNWIKNTRHKYIFQENSGSAGGFHRGISEYINFSFDFFWLMDDDGYPQDDCLSNLLDCALNNKDICVFSPNLLDEKLQSHFENIFSKTDLKLVNHIGGPWNGILVKSEVFKMVGLPNRSFFIWGEEYEFFNRVKNYGFLNILVSNASFIHKKTGFNLKNCPRPFFLIRNLFWIYRLNNYNSQFESKYKFLFRGLLLSFQLVTFGIIGLNFSQIKQTINGVYNGLFKSLPNEDISN